MYRTYTMAIWVVKLSCKRIKIRSIFGRNSTTQLSHKCKIKIWLYKSIFYVKNDLSLSILFFFDQYFLEHIFCYWHFLTTPIFKTLYFRNDAQFLMTMSLEHVDFLPKNVSTFVSLSWKIDNPYCHNIHHQNECLCVSKKCDKK